MGELILTGLVFPILTGMFAHHYQQSPKKWLGVFLIWSGWLSAGYAFLGPAKDVSGNLGYFLNVGLFVILFYGLVAGVFITIDALEHGQGKPPTSS